MGCKMASLLILISFISLNSYAVNNCEPQTPDQECMDYVLSAVNYDRQRAVSECQGGVTVSCMEYVLSSVNYDRLRAARSCRGN